MARMKAPRVVEQPPDVLSIDELSRLLRTCEGRDFDSRRDAAMLRLLIDCGLPRAEIGSLAVADVDLDAAVTRIVGKGGRERRVPSV